MREGQTNIVLQGAWIVDSRLVNLIPAFGWRCDGIKVTVCMRLRANKNSALIFLWHGVQEVFTLFSIWHLRKGRGNEKSTHA